MGAAKGTFSHAGPVHIAAGEAAVIIELGQRDPAFAPLTSNECLGSLALCIERVKLLIEAFLRRFPRIDRAPQASGGRLLYHECHFQFLDQLCLTHSNHRWGRWPPGWRLHRMERFPDTSEN